MRPSRCTSRLQTSRVERTNPGYATLRAALRPRRSGDFGRSICVPRQYVEVRKYFDAKVGDLKGFGLRPLVATADFPNKVTFRAGLVIAEVIG